MYARAYCRNPKLRAGEAFGLIRLEAEQRFGPKECLLQTATDPRFVADLWMKRYGSLPARVTRLSREVQAVQVHKKVKSGELDYKQGERLMAFLDLERLGLAKDFYPATVYQARRREARKLGYSANDSGATAIGGRPRPTTCALQACSGRGRGRRSWRSPGRRPLTR